MLLWEKGALHMMNHTNFVAHSLVDANTWLIEHGFQLNNREWASLIWFGILTIWLLPQAHIRHCFGAVIRSALSPKLYMVWISFIVWIVLIVISAQWQRLWDPQLTKDTFVWAVTTGVVSFSNFTDAHKQGFFKSAAWKTVGVTAFMGYLVSLNSFSLLIEILLQPLSLGF
ncbi:MAG: hypothetical protein PHO37_02585 [Kiritimatiellae bacterium]|nr:hypothetical protein [Kiritimatiellia bacterium]